MKKIISLLLVTVLVLAGCGSSNGTVGTDEPVTLKVMGWSFGTEEEAGTNIDRQIIASYEEANPNVTIEIIAPPEGQDYNEYLNSLFAAGDGPDVFMYSSHAAPVTQGWAMDLTDYVKSNDTYNSIVPILTEGGTINGKTYAIPVKMGTAGIYQNNDILENKNITPLEPGYTLDQLVENIKAATDETTKGYDAFMESVDWIPAILNSDIEWFNYNGETYDYNNQAFIDAVNLTKEICQGNYSFDCAEPDFQVNGDWAVSSGQIAYFKTQTNWDVAQGTGQNFEYIGMPEGKTIVIPDYMYVSSATEFPEQAVDFILYYGAESYQQKADFAKENNLMLDPPITDDAEFKQIYTDYTTENNFTQLLQDYNNAINNENLILESLKVIPSYNDVRYNTLTGITNEETGEEYTTGTLIIDIAKGKVSLADYADDLNDLSASVQEQIDSLIQ